MGGAPGYWAGRDRGGSFRGRPVHVSRSSLTDGSPVAPRAATPGLEVMILHVSSDAVGGSCVGLSHGSVLVSIGTLRDVALHRQIPLRLWCRVRAVLQQFARMRLEGHEGGTPTCRVECRTYASPTVNVCRFAAQCRGTPGRAHVPDAGQPSGGVAAVRPGRTSGHGVEASLGWPGAQRLGRINWASHGSVR